MSKWSSKKCEADFLGTVAKKLLFVHCKPVSDVLLLKDLLPLFLLHLLCLAAPSKKMSGLALLFAAEAEEQRREDGK